MSRFIEKLKTASGEELQPMGFGLGKKAQEKPRIQLIASPVDLDASRLSAVSDADAGIVRVSSTAEVKVLEKLCQNGSIPWGGWLKSIGSDITPKLLKSACDFIIFSPADTPVTVPKDEKLGRIIEVDPSLSDGLLRTIEDLPVDAALAGGEKEDSLTWQHLMRFRRLAGLIGKPLLVSVSSKVTEDELQILWESGVSGVVIELEDGEAWERLKALRKEIDKVTPRATRKHVKRTVLLPKITPEAPEPVEEEEEDE